MSKNDIVQISLDKFSKIRMSERSSFMIEKIGCACCKFSMMGFECEHPIKKKTYKNDQDIRSCDMFKINEVYCEFLATQSIDVKQIFEYGVIL